MIKKYPSNRRYWFTISVLLLMQNYNVVLTQNVSPCPRIFQYVFDGSDWIGIVEIPSPMLGESVTVHVHLTIRAVLPTAYFGKIELMSPRSEILQDILAHRPVRYRVRFPLPSPVPKLSAIVLNGRAICSAVPDTGGVITTIKLEHTLYTTSAASEGEINSMYSGGTQMEHQAFGLNLVNEQNHQNQHQHSTGNDLWSFVGVPTQAQNFNQQINNPSTILQPQNPPFRPQATTQFQTQQQKPMTPLFAPQKPVFAPQNGQNTGFQSQNTGFPSQNQQNTGFQPQNTGFQPQNQHQNTGFQTQTTGQKPAIGNFHINNSGFQSLLQPQIPQIRPQQNMNFAQNQQETTVFGQYPQQQQTDWGNLHQQPQMNNQQINQHQGDILPTRPTVLIPPFRPPTTNPPYRVGQTDPNVVLREMDQLCGRALSRPNNLVVRGEIARKGDWPWLVALYVITDTGLNFNCGASLVSRKLVVTAAHCLFGPDNRQHDKEKILLILGRFNINDWTDNAVRAPIERALPHPDYRANTLGTDADIALLVLKLRVEFTELIRPLCLWRGSDRLERIVGMNATVVGWGRDETGLKTTPEPRVARVPVVSRETCLLSKEEFRHLITSNRTFCAGAKGSGPCNGDSGGGLVLPQGDRWALRGVVSVSLVEQISKQCDVNEFIVFTDATQFHHWIVSYMTE